MNTRPALLLAVLLLAACSGAVSPADLGIEVELPRLRIAGTPGWRDEPELLVLQVGETVKWPTHEEIDAASENAAFLLCLDSGLDAWPGITAAFAGAINLERPRMYFAGRDSGSGVDAIAMVADRGLEDELRRLGGAWLAPSDAGPEGAFELRITRAGDDVRYRWRRLGTDGPVRWDLGDVTISGSNAPAEGSTTAIPALARALEERFTVSGAPRALVAFELGQGVRPADFLRALQCGRGSREVAFIPVMLLTDIVEVLRIDPPEPVKGADDGIGEGLAGGDWLFVNLGINALRGSPRLGRPEFRIRGQAYGEASEIPLPDPPPPGLYLRVDSEMPFRLFDPLIQWAAEKRIRLRFAMSKEDPNFRRERSIEVPLGRGAGATALRIAAGSKAGAVIRDAHRLLADGSTALEFVLER